MKDRKRAVIFILILVIAASVAAYILREERGRGPGDSLTIYGNIDIRQVNLAFYDEGRIERLLVDEGQEVKAGQLLAVIDPARYESAVEHLKGEMETQEQILTRLHNGSRPQEIKEARARVRAGEAVVKDARITYERLKTLAKTQYVSRQQLDDAEAKLDAALANLDAARQVLELAVIGPRTEDIRAAEAKLRAIKGELALAQERLKDTRLFSPSDGIIRERILEPGDMAFPQQPVYTLALTNPLWVRAYVPEPDLGRIALGMKAEVRVDSYPGKAFEGWVGYISPTAEFTPRNVETPDLRTRLVYQVRIYVCNHENRLRLGMPATVTIRLNQKMASPVVSPSSVCRER